MTVATLDAHPGRLQGWGHDLAIAAQIAERVCGTEFVPKAMRGQPDVVVAAILYGAELGIDPMTALQSIHVVEGRPAPSAELMRALILAAGHSFTVHEFSGTKVRVSGLRAGRPEAERVTVEWNLDMARAAGLLGKQNWRSYPRAMLTARATGDLARILFPDVVKGLGYVAETEDTAQAIEAWGPPEVSEAEAPVRPALQRARRPRKAALERPGEVRPPVAPPPEPHGPNEPPVGGTPPGARPPGNPNDPYDPTDVPLPDDMLPRGTGRPAPHRLPDPEPEAPPDEAPGPIRPGLLKAVHASLTGELGSIITREERLGLLSAIVGHELSSSKELTQPEGRVVLQYLARVASGQATYDLDPDSGAFTVTLPADIAEGLP
jgi:hypothetical protein